MATARDIMTCDIRTVTEDMPLTELGRAFSAHGVSGFPVLDAAGELVGVVTEGDLIHQNERLHIPTTVALFDAVIMLGSSKKLEEEIRRVTATTVGEIMSREPVTVPCSASVEEVASLMAEEGYHTLPVLDDQGRLVGVIGKIDVIRSLSGS